MSVKDLAFETLRVTVDDQVLTVTLDDTGNPLNLFTWQRMEELGELMSRLRDETAVRAIVLTGSGRYFSGGGSFDLFATLDTSESAERIRRASRKLYKDMLEVGQPIVCAVNGPAIGAGCSLLLLSDFAFASSTVTLSDPHVRRGLAAADGAAIWTMFMGPIRAKRFLLTGQELTAAQAADLGMFSVVCEPDETLAQATAFARELASGARSRSRTRSRCATGTSARSSSRRMRPASRSRCWTSGAATTGRPSRPSRRAGHRCFTGS
jgi:enoyl-CoA hydratase